MRYYANIIIKKRGFLIGKNRKSLQLGTSAPVPEIKPMVEPVKKTEQPDIKPLSIISGDLPKLTFRMDELGMTSETLSWYMDLRRYGGCKHAGFGIGFDRLLMYVTGMENIRDVQPFPRTTNNLKY